MTRLLKRRKASRRSGTWTIKKIRMKVSKRNFRLAELYAHRGYHDKPHIPENSLAAFRRAVEHGLASEFDVHLIADGSLVVFHDDDLERETGVKGSIEAYDITSLRKLRLEGTDEKIPTFDEVLDVYEDSGIPLLIELKCVNNNYRELTEAVIRRLDSYKGEYVVESFDPRALMVYRRLRPEVIRGQLSQNYFRSREGLPYLQVVILTHFMLNKLTKPDFLAYKYQDRNDRGLRALIKKRGYGLALWTVTSPEEYRLAEEAGSIPIFEQISPEELAELVRK